MKTHITFRHHEILSPTTFLNYSTGRKELSIEKDSVREEYITIPIKLMCLKMVKINNKEIKYVVCDLSKYGGVYLIDEMQYNCLRQELQNVFKTIT